ncbi:MAG TPA: cytochrome P450 [Pirellulaceae bacterium]|nr:cytochrome P450 [Pirellulaceae bacterium]
MLNPFSDELRRDPYPMYQQMRTHSPMLHLPPPFDVWMVFDYDGVKRVLSDHEAFSSAVPAPKNWFLFHDPPRHTKLRGLISRAFTPRVVANLEPRIRALSRELLDRHVPRGQMDLATDYATPLPMMVISEMIGIPPADWLRFKRWSDMVLRLSYTMGGIDPAEAQAAMNDFESVTVEMDEYVGEMIRERSARPANDLMTGLVQAEVDGERLTQYEILGFFQLLVVGGQETTANLISNAVLCLLENPRQLALLRERMELLPSAIEEVLRYRSPLPWLMRTPRSPVELSGQTIPPGELVLPMIGSANRDERHFPAADQFDITRDPNPHIAFGHGVHFCLGATLARLEARIALTDLLARMDQIELASDAPWPPRRALNVHGPASLPIRLQTAKAAVLD